MKRLQTGTQGRHLCREVGGRVSDCSTFWRKIRPGEGSPGPPPALRGVPWQEDMPTLMPLLCSVTS